MASSQESAGLSSGHRRQRPDHMSLPPIDSNNEKKSRRKQHFSKHTENMVLPGGHEERSVSPTNELEDDSAGDGTDEDVIKVSSRRSPRHKRGSRRSGTDPTPEEHAATTETAPRRKTKRKKETSSGASQTHTFASERFHGTATAAWTALHDEDIVRNEITRTKFTVTSPQSRNTHNHDHHHFFEPRQQHLQPRHERDTETAEDDTGSEDGGAHQRASNRPHRTGYGVLHAGGFKRATRVQDFSTKSSEDHEFPEAQLYGVPYVRAVLDMRFASLTALAPSMLFGFILCFQVLESSMKADGGGSDTIVKGTSGQVLVITGLIHTLSVLALLCVVESAVASDFDKGTRPWLLLSSMCIVVAFVVSMVMQQYEIDIHRFNHNSSLFACSSLVCTGTTLSQHWTDETEAWYRLTVVRTVLVSFAWCTHYMTLRL